MFGRSKKSPGEGDKRPVPGSDEAIRLSSAAERKEHEESLDRQHRRERRNRLKGVGAVAGALAAAVIFGNAVRACTTDKETRPDTVSISEQLSDVATLIEYGACADELRLEAELTKSKVLADPSDDNAIRNEYVAQFDMYTRAAQLAESNNVSCYSMNPASEDYASLTPNFDIQGLRSIKACANALRNQVQYVDEYMPDASSQDRELAAVRLELQAQLAETYQVSCN